jgi:hypothetical protein
VTDKAGLLIPSLGIAIGIGLDFSIHLTTAYVQLGLMICLSLITCAAATLVLVPGLVLLRVGADRKPRLELMIDSPPMSSRTSKTG